MFTIMVVVIYLLIRLLINHNVMHIKPDGKVKGPLEIAEERYAKGEINKAEFDQIKIDIS